MTTMPSYEIRVSSPLAPSIRMYLLDRMAGVIELSRPDINSLLVQFPAELHFSDDLKTNERLIEIIKGTGTTAQLLEVGLDGSKRVTMDSTVRAHITGTPQRKTKVLSSAGRKSISPLATPQLKLTSFSDLIAPDYVGLAGALVLLLGTFAPIFSAPIVGSVNLWLGGIWSSTLYLVAAVLTVIALVFVGRRSWLAIPGFVAGGYITFLLITMAEGLRLMEETSIAPEDDPWGLATGITTVMQEAFRFRYDYGWFLLITGALLIIGTGIYSFMMNRKSDLSPS